MSSSEKYDYLTMDNVTNIVIKSCPNNMHDADLHVWFYFFLYDGIEEELSIPVTFGSNGWYKSRKDLWGFNSDNDFVVTPPPPPVSICLRTTGVQSVVELVLDSQFFKSISKQINVSDRNILLNISMGVCFVRAT